MNNPNNRPFTSEDDDDDDTSPSSISQGPTIVNATRFNFLLNAQKQQQETEAKSSEEDDDDEEEDTSATPGTRRTRAARLYRSLMKRSRPVRPVAPAPLAAELPPAETAQAQPTSSETTEETPANRELPELELHAKQEPVNEEAATAEEVQPAPEAPDTEDTDPEDPPILVAPVPANSNTANVPRTNANRLPPRPTPNSPAPAAANTAPTTSGPPPAVPPPLMVAGSPSLNAIAPAAANTLPPVAVLANTAAANRPPAILDRRAGLGGPFVAFLAANYLSRRRHKRTQKEAKKIRTELADTQTKQRTETQRLNRVEKVAARAAERPLVAPVPRSKVEVKQSTEIVSKPVTLAEAIAAAPISKEVIAKQPPLRESKSVAPQVEKPLKMPKAEQLTASATEVFMAQQLVAKEVAKKPVESLIVPPEAQKTIEKDTKEATFDRRYEVKDAKAPKAVPVAHQSAAPRSQAAPTPVLPPIVPDTQKQSSNSALVPASAPSPSPAPATDLYKQSMQTGVMLGLVVVVIGAIGYILTQ